jgi:predicted transcriptional regulator
MASAVRPEKAPLERDLDFYEAITCVFNFKEHELLVYMDLASHPRSTVDEMAARLGRDRSWVHRALSTLVNLGMVRRFRRILQKGGYIYQYEAVPRERAREMLKQSLEKWCGGMVQRIEEGLAEAPEPAAVSSAEAEGQT